MLFKVLITGGGIANFTNVAATFKGIVTALTEFQGKLLEHNVSIYVRRAGPNYQEGLRWIFSIDNTLCIFIYFMNTFFICVHTSVTDKKIK